MIVARATVQKESDIYMKIFLENKAEMMIRKADLAVFSFMLKLVRCKKGAALAQLDKDAKVCEADGGLELHFDDQELQAELERRMTPAARAAVREVLGEVDAAAAREAAREEAVEAQAASSLVQKGKQGIGSDAEGDEDDDDDEDIDDDIFGAGSGSAAPQNATSKTLLTPPVSSFGILSGRQTVEKPKKKGAVTTPPPPPAPPAIKSKVQKEVQGGQFACKNGPVDCGLLHDNMSLMWGKFKDLVDELQAKMDKDAQNFDDLKKDINMQITTLTSAKATFSKQMNEATAQKSADVEEQRAKSDEE